MDEGIVVARLQIEERWITYISVYAPTDDSSQEIKDGFYEKLQCVVDKTHGCRDCFSLFSFRSGY